MTNVNAICLVINLFFIIILRLIKWLCYLFVVWNIFLRLPPGLSGKCILAICKRRIHRLHIHNSPLQ